MNNMNLIRHHNENNFAVLRFFAVITMMFAESNIITNSHDDIWVFISGYQSDVANLGESILLLIMGYLAIQSINKCSSIRAYLYARIIGIYPQLIISIVFTAIVSYVLFVQGLYFRSYNFLVDIRNYLLNIFIPFTSVRYLEFTGNNLSLVSIVVKYHFLISILYALKIIRFRYLILCLFLGVLMFIQSHPYSFYDTYYYACLISGSLFWLFKDKIKYKKFYSIISTVILLFTSYLSQFWCIAFLICGAYLLFGFTFNKRVKFYNFDKYGDFSYGIFLYGFLVQNIVMIAFHGQMSNTLNYLISLPIAILCGVLSHKLVKKSCMNFKNRFL